MVGKRKNNLKHSRRYQLFLVIIIVLLQILLQPFHLLPQSQKAYADDGDVPEIRIPPGSTGYVVSYLIEGTDKYVPTISNPLRFVETYDDGIFEVETPNAVGYELVPNQNTKVKVLPGQVSSIDIFYRKIVDYQIRYVDQDTNQLLAGLAENPVFGQAGVGSYLNINLPLVTDYELVANQPTSVLIKDLPMNEITIYYKKRQLQTMAAYQIHYLVEGTADKAPGAIPNPVIGSGVVGSELRLVFPEVANYSPVPGQAEKIILSADASKNVVYLYYRPQVASNSQAPAPVPSDPSSEKSKINPPNTGFNKKASLNSQWLIGFVSVVMLVLSVFIKKPKKHRLR